MVDARLADGSRVNAIIPPLSAQGPMLTIRRFGGAAGSAIDDLISKKALNHGDGPVPRSGRAGQAEHRRQRRHRAAARRHC